MTVTLLEGSEQGNRCCRIDPPVLTHNRIARVVEVDCRTQVDVESSGYRLDVVVLAAEDPAGTGACVVSRMSCVAEIERLTGLTARLYQWFENIGEESPLLVEIGLRRYQPGLLEAEVELLDEYPADLPEREADVKPLANEPVDLRGRAIEVLGEFCA